MNDTKTFTACGIGYINSLKKSNVGFFSHLPGKQKKIKFYSNISGSGAVFPFYKVLFVSTLINRIWVRVRREKDTLEELQVTK